jgi:DNA-binding HxlR family transcriptional regulator
VHDAEGRALAQALQRVGDRWSLQVVHALLPGSQRFGTLQQRLGIAPNVLTQRLRTLAEDGLVVAEAYQRRPARYRYALTVRGRELAGVLRLLAAWTAVDDGPRHPACGTPVVARWWCETCDRPAGESPSDDLIRM